MPRTNRGPRLERNSRGVWEIRWTENGRSHRVSTRADDLQEAQKVFAGWMTEYTEEKTSGGGDPRVIDVLDWYWDGGAQERLSAPERAESILATLRRGLPEGLRVSGLDDRVIGRYLSGRRTGAIEGGRKGKGAGRKVKSSGTLRLELSYLVAALNWAARRGRVDRVPHIELPPASPPRELWLSAEERTELLDELERETRGQGRMTRAHRFALLALGTGARGRSIETLTWHQVDFRRGQIRFDLDGDRRTGGRTRKRRVPVPIASWLRPWLDRMARERTSEYVLDRPAPVVTPLARVCRQVYRRTGNARFLQVTRHTLRHTAATHMALSGVPLWEIAGVLGDTVGTVTRVYAHHAPEHLRRGVEALDPTGGGVDRDAGGEVL